MKQRVSQTKENIKSPVGKKEANPQELAILVSARPPAGDFSLPEYLPDYIAHPRHPDDK